MRWVEKQLLRCRSQHHVRVTDIKGDIAPARPFRSQALRDRCSVLEGLAKDQPPPAAIQREIAFDLAFAFQMQRRFQAGVTHTAHPVLHPA